MKKKIHELGRIQEEETILVVREVPVTAETLPPGGVSVTDAARYLGVSDETVRRYIDAGRIRAERQASAGREGWRHVIPTEELNRVRRLSVKVVRLNP